MNIRGSEISMMMMMMMVTIMYFLAWQKLDASVGKLIIPKSGTNSTSHGSKTDPFNPLIEHQKRLASHGHPISPLAI